MLKGTTLRTSLPLWILLATTMGEFAIAGDLLGPWQVRLRPPSYGPLNDITFGDPLLVAVGNAGTIIYSIDGRNWTRAQSDTTNDLYSVIYPEPGLWVAVGTNQTITVSSDGMNWATVHSAQTGAVLGVAYGNGKYVAIGFPDKDIEIPCHCENPSPNFRTLTSGDGFNWDPIATTNRFRSIAFGNGVFVAINSQPYIWEPNAQVKVSTNGVDWTVVQPGSYDHFERRVQFINNRFFISSEGYYTPDIEGGTYTYPIIFSSQDGTNWVNAAFPDTPRSYDYNGGIAGVAFGNGVYTAIGSSHIYSSTDGQTWLKSGSAPTTAIAFGRGALLPEGRFVVVDKDAINLSETGKDWTPIFAQRPSFVDVAASSNAVVAIGPYWIAASTNGVDFQPQHVPYVLRSISFGTVSGVTGEGAFLVVGEHVIGISKNGIDWAFQDRAESYFGSYVGADKFFALHSENYSPSGLDVSTDAVTWTAVPSPIPRFSYYIISPAHSLTFGNGRFVLLSLDLRSGTPPVLQAALSNDAITWTNLFPIVTNDTPKQILFGKSRFVATTSSHNVWTSADAQRWIAPTNVQADVFAYGKGTFVAFTSNGDLAVSPDGVSWGAPSNPWAPFAGAGDQIHGATYCLNTFYAVGDGGLILQSSSINSDHALSVSVDATGLALFANAEPGSYTLERSDDLIHWQSVATFTTGNESDLPIYQTPPPTSAQFFRLVK